MTLIQFLKTIKPIARCVDCKHYMLQDTKYYLNENKLVEVPPSRRAFLMGNALVIGVVEKIGQVLYKKIEKNA